MKEYRLAGRDIIRDLLTDSDRLFEEWCIEIPVKKHHSDVFVCRIVLLPFLKSVFDTESAGNKKAQAVRRSGCRTGFTLQLVSYKTLIYYFRHLINQ